jgi:hypothetical protein
MEHRVKMQVEGLRALRMPEEELKVRWSSVTVVLVVDGHGRDGENVLGGC